MTQRTRSYDIAVKSGERIRQTRSRQGTPPKEEDAWTTLSSGSTVLQGKAQLMTDEVTDAYHTRKRHGGVIVNAVSSVKTESECKETTVHSLRRQRTYSYSPWYYHEALETGVISGFNSSSVYLTGVPTLDFSNKADLRYSEDDISSCRNDLLDRIYRNADAAIASSLVDLCEIHKTARLFPGILKRATRLTCKFLDRMGPIIARTDVRCLDKRDLSSVIRFCTDNFRDARDLWLAYRYGVRPLMRSAEQIASAVMRPYVNALKVSRARELLPLVRTEGELEYDDTVAFKYHGTWSRTVTCECNAGLLVNITPGIGDSLAARLGALNFIDAAWDLVPFSFIVDWFIGVGDSLGKLCPTVGTRWAGSWFTVREVSRTVYSWDQAYPRPVTATKEGLYINGAGATSSKTSTYWSRTANPVGLYDLLPTLHLKIGTLQVADSLAILHRLYDAFTRKAL